MAFKNNVYRLYPTTTYLYACEEGGAILRRLQWGQTNWERVTVEQDWSGDLKREIAAYSIAEDSSGTLYVRGSLGIFQMNGGTGTMIPNPVVDEKELRPSDGMIIDSADTMYALFRKSSSERLLYKRVATDWLLLGKLNISMSRSKPHMVLDSQNNLYIGGAITQLTIGEQEPQTVNGVVKYNNGTADTLEPLDCALGEIAAIACDSNNQLYVGGRPPRPNPNSVKAIRKWDGTTWHDIDNMYTYENGNQTPFYQNSVGLITDNQNNLYAFVEPGNKILKRVSKAEFPNLPPLLQLLP